MVRKEPPGYAFAALVKVFINTLTMKCFNLIRIAENKHWCILSMSHGTNYLRSLRPVSSKGEHLALLYDLRKY